MTTKICSVCEGTGIAEGALGELERCAECRTTGVVPAEPVQPWREPELKPLVPESSWSPYPWPFGRHRGYYDREAA